MSNHTTLSQSEMEALLKVPVCEALQKIVDRGSDGAFTAWENETFDMLIAFVRNTKNSMHDRARACVQYDSMMMSPDEVLSLWMTKGAEAVVNDFIETIEE